MYIRTKYPAAVVKYKRNDWQIGWKVLVVSKTFLGCVCDLRDYCELKCNRELIENNFFIIIIHILIATLKKQKIEKYL